MVVTNLPGSFGFLPRPQSQPTAQRTHVSWGPAGCGEHAAGVFHLGEAKVGDHDLGVFIQAVVQQILWLGRREGGEEEWEMARGQQDLLPPQAPQRAPQKPLWRHNCHLGWRHKKIKFEVPKGQGPWGYGREFPINLRCVL